MEKNEKDDSIRRARDYIVRRKRAQMYPAFDVDIVPKTARGTELSALTFRARASASDGRRTPRADGRSIDEKRYIYGWDCTTSRDDPPFDSASSLRGSRAAKSTSDTRRANAPSSATFFACTNGDTS